jgi:hypothetical protein
MTRPHDADKLARLKSDLDLKLAARNGVAAARVEAWQLAKALKSQAADAAASAGVRWDASRQIDDLVQALQAEHKSAAADPKIAAALSQAREARDAQAHLERLTREGARIEKEIRPLSDLVRACDAWLAEPEAL